jgi:uncharacterized 2Fe-2S/4Fe-4S cluster protein (DUF4445 family)
MNSVARIEIDGKDITAKIGSNLLENVLSSQVYVSSICGGRGACGKCRVIVKRGREYLSPLSDIERIYLNPQEIEKGYRLACRAKITGSGKVLIEVPEESKIEPQKLLVKGYEVKVPLAPLVKKYFISLKQATLNDVRPDADRLLDALKNLSLDELSISYSVLAELPEIIRRANWNLTVAVWDCKDVIGVEEGDKVSRCFGVAIDIGTTKLASYLVNLNDGKTIEVESMLNPQVVKGADVASRVSYAMRSFNNLEELQRLVVDGINKMIDKLCKKANVKKSEIYELTIAGNTVMHHIFFKITPKYIGLSPFAPAVGFSINVKAKDLGIDVNREANVHSLPNIAGFVGADAVADILCSQIHKSDELKLLIDIGTNTEIIIGNKDRLVACSAPAGPAIEGAHIKDGMRAEIGAIEHVWIDLRNYDVGYKVIGNVRPKGLCGSAIIDTVAHLYKAGIINPDGSFNLKIDTPRIRRLEKGCEFVIAWEEETATGKDITFTSNDVREIQLVKGAIRSGVEILMSYINVSADDISTLYLAGAFGNYVDPQSARTIGMYPPIQLSKVKFIGNAAGSGAKMCLVSKHVREEAKRVCKKIEYVELSVQPNFLKEFIKSTYIPYKDEISFNLSY